MVVSPQYKSSDRRSGLPFVTMIGVLACCMWAFSPAQASHNFDLNLGGLGEIHVNHDSWGHRTFQITDRGGDSISGDRSIFGPRHNEVHVLGNDIDVHGGAFGNKSYSVNTMVGDKFQGQRNFGDMGHHDNQVDLQGSSRAAEHVFGDGQAPKGNSPLQNSAVQPGAEDRPASENINKLPGKTSTNTATPTSTDLPKPENNLP